METTQARHTPGPWFARQMFSGNWDIAAENGDGTNRAVPGHYEISGAYGGYNLHRICNEGGGVENVFGCGHVPARDLYNRMRAYLEGLRFKG